MRPRPQVEFELKLDAEQVAFFQDNGYLAIDRITTSSLSSPVTNWAEVRRVARQWARLVRTRLDASVDWKITAR